MPEMLFYVSELTIPILSLLHAKEKHVPLCIPWLGLKQWPFWFDTAFPFFCKTFSSLLLKNTRLKCFLNKTAGVLKSVFSLLTSFLKAVLL